MKIFDVKIEALNRQQARDRLIAMLEKKTPSMIATVNVEFVVLAEIDPEFKNILNKKTSLNTIDGSGLLWALWFMRFPKIRIPVLKEIILSLSWILSLILYPLSLAIARKKIGERISGSDFIWDIADVAVANDKKIFILGNKHGLDPNVAEKVSLEMQTKIYGLKVAGSYDGTGSIADEKDIVEIIKKSDADILLVGLGTPAQEKWLARNLGKTDCKIGIGLGGTFDFIAGVQKRAPKWLRAIGFEWLFRLIQQPKRFRRQLALPKFAFKVLKDKLTN